MKLKILELLVLLSDVYASTSTYTTRPCGSNLTNLWLDVVAVVDNSQGMTNDGLTTIAANIASVFSAGTRIGTDPSEPRTTRLGLVTYNSVATKNADLNKFQSIDDLYSNIFEDLSEVSDVDESYLERGLAAAEEILEAGRAEFNRGHYKQVVIVYASTYNGDGQYTPTPVANRLKTSGVKIITVAYDQGGDWELMEDLAKISSPRFNFSNTDKQGIIGQIQGALVEANCFCPTTWIQYRTSYADSTSKPFGVCIQPVGLNAVWRAAKISCGNRWKNAHLADEYSQEKHDFVLEVVKDTAGFHPPYSYHFGLNFNNGNWTWDRPNGWVQPNVENWFRWNQGFPISTSSMTAGINVQKGAETYWQNTGMYNTGANYVCETISCDTDNFCESGGDDEVLV